MTDFCYIYNAIKNLESYLSESLKKLGTMSTQNANAVDITGGTISAYYVVNTPSTTIGEAVPFKINPFLANNVAITVTLPTATASLVGAWITVSYTITGTGSFTLPGAAFTFTSGSGSLTYYCVPVGSGYAWA